MPATTPPTQLVSIGACMKGVASGGDVYQDKDPLHFVRCAVTAQQCVNDHQDNDDDEAASLFFLSSQDIARLTSSDNHPAYGKCTSIEQVEGGRCQDDIHDMLDEQYEPWASYVCMNGLKQNCHDPEQMIGASSSLSSSSTAWAESLGCTLVQDITANHTNTTLQLEATQYSKCFVKSTTTTAPTSSNTQRSSSSSKEQTNNNGYVCRWDINACPNGSTGLLPYQSNGDCPCQKVQTGACIYGNTGGNPIVDCAVDATACGASSQFLTVEQLQATYNVDCRLCPGGDAGGDNGDNNNDGNNNMASHSTSDLSDFGVLAVAIFVAMLLITFIYCLLRCCSRRQNVCKDDNYGASFDDAMNDLELDAKHGSFEDCTGENNREGTIA